MPTLGAGAFFGPWSLTATAHEGFFAERFVISGSGASDGIFHVTDDGSPVALFVDGSRWLVEFQSRFGDEDWFSYDPMRSTVLAAPDGLTVTLFSEQIVLPGAMVFNHSLVMRLVSQDPEINPPWPQIPVDFTLPKPGTETDRHQS
jgi:hypothetical protein